METNTGLSGVRMKCRLKDEGKGHYYNNKLTLKFNYFNINKTEANAVAQARVQKQRANITSFVWQIACEWGQ